MCQNIELFDEYTAKVFALLYSTFPVKQSIEIIDFVGKGAFDDFGVIVNAKNEPLPEAKVAWHTLIWLKEADFISIGREHAYTDVSDVTLTIKGLEVLKARPESIQPAKRIGNEVIGALKVGNVEAAKELVRQAIKLSVGL